MYLLDQALEHLARVLLVNIAIIASFNFEIVMHGKAGMSM